MGIIVLVSTGLFIAGQVYNTADSGLSRQQINHSGYGGSLNSRNMDTAISDNIGLGSAAYEPSSKTNNLFSIQKESVQGTTMAAAPAEGTLTKKKIIKNGSLTIYVKDAEKAVAQIKALTDSLEGFVAASNIRESSSGHKTGTITIRVPAKHFEKAMHGAKQIATEVEQENVSASDVTEEFEDNQTRLRNLRAEESQFLIIMNKAVNIDEIMRVTRELSRVRGQIESIEGRLQFMSRQVEMSTIHIRLEADSDLKVLGLKWRPLIVAKRSLNNMFKGLTNYFDKMLAFILLLPVILLWVATFVVGFILAWRLLLWIYHRFLQKHHEPE